MSKKRLNYYTDIEKFYRQNRNEMNDLFEEFLNICKKNSIDMNYNDETFSKFLHTIFSNAKFSNDRYKLLK